MRRRRRGAAAGRAGGVWRRDGRSRGAVPRGVGTTSTHPQRRGALSIGGRLNEPTQHVSHVSLALARSLQIGCWQIKYVLYCRPSKYWSSTLRIRTPMLGGSPAVTTAARGGMAALRPKRPPPWPALLSHRARRPVERAHVGGAAAAGVCSAAPPRRHRDRAAASPHCPLAGRLPTPGWWPPTPPVGVDQSAPAIPPHRAQSFHGRGGSSSRPGAGANHRHPPPPPPRPTAP